VTATRREGPTMEKEGFIDELRVHLSQELETN